MSRRGPSFNPNPPTPVGTKTDRVDQSNSNEEDAGKTYEPSNITIDKVQVDHPEGTLDISSNFDYIVITEDIFSNSITCRIEIIDTNEKLAELEFDGTETVTIAFHSEKNREINHKFNIYRTEVEVDKNSGTSKLYQLFGISEEFMTQSTMDINRTMTGNISNLVSIVYNEMKRETGTKRLLKDRHFTNGNVILNIPGMTPYETIEMLQDRAYSTKYSSSIFLFYEDFRGYNFCNVEQLIAEGRRNPIKYTYNPGAQIDDQKNVAGQMTIIEIAFPQGKNVLDKIKSGAYASQVAEIDILNQKVDRTLLTVKENFKDFYHLDEPAITYDKEAVIDKHLNFINSTTWMNKYNDGIRHKEDNFGPLITRRKFYSDSLDQLIMNCVVPGNSDLSSGTVLDLSMVEMSAEKDNPDQEKKISGKYLITQVNHSIGGGKYMCSLSCSKDSYKANVTKVDDYIVGKR